MKMPLLLAGLAVAFGLVGTARANDANAYTPELVAGASALAASAPSALNDAAAASASQHGQDDPACGCAGNPAHCDAPHAPRSTAPAPGPARHHRANQGAPAGGGSAPNAPTTDAGQLPSASMPDLGWRSLLPGSIQ